MRGGQEDIVPQHLHEAGAHGGQLEGHGEVVHLLHLEGLAVDIILGRLRV